MILSSELYWEKKMFYLQKILSEIIKFCFLFFVVIGITNKEGLDLTAGPRPISYFIQ